MGTETSAQLFIHIDWSGPHSLKEVASFNRPQDHGVYQVYGAHAVYGSGALLYIGLAVKQTFAVRFAEHKAHGAFVSNADANRIEIYLGRLWGPKTPEPEKWDHMIELAERLLVHAHDPAENTQRELGAWKHELRLVHVINWHRYRDLLPEVSGACWAGDYPDFANWTHFGTLGARPSMS